MPCSKNFPSKLNKVHDEFVSIIRARTTNHFNPKLTSNSEKHATI